MWTEWHQTHLMWLGDIKHINFDVVAIKNNEIWYVYNYRCDINNNEFWCFYRRERHQKQLVLFISVWVASQTIIFDVFLGWLLLICLYNIGVTRISLGRRQGWAVRRWICNLAFTCASAIRLSIDFHVCLHVNFNVRIVYWAMMTRSISAEH